MSILRVHSELKLLLKVSCEHRSQFQQQAEARFLDKAERKTARKIEDEAKRKIEGANAIRTLKKTREDIKERQRIKEDMEVFKDKIEQAISICQIDYQISEFARHNGISNFRRDAAIRNENWLKNVIPPTDTQSLGRSPLFEIILKFGQLVTKRIEEQEETSDSKDAENHTVQPKSDPPTSFKP